MKHKRLTQKAKLQNTRPPPLLFGDFDQPQKQCVKTNTASAETKRPFGAGNETPNMMQLGQMAIEPVLLVISIMASIVTQAVTLPTAALAIEAGPLGGKSERTEGMPHLG